MKIIDPLVDIQIESIKFMTIMEYGQEDVNVRCVLNRSISHSKISRLYIVPLKSLFLY